MQTFVSLNDATLSAAETASQAQRLRQMADSHPGLEVSAPQTAAPAPGQKGGSLDLATFGLALVTSGAITALIQVLQHYLSRNKKASVSFEAPDGRKMSVSAENLTPEQLEQTTARLKTIFDDG